MPAAPLALELITLDPTLQQRGRIDEHTVESYSEIIDQLPPVQVIFDGCHNWLWNGFHRYHAAKRAGRDTIEAEIVHGTRRDAILKSCSANAENGLHRSVDDKAKAVRTLLEDAEWGQKSTDWIAEQCRVSWNFANKIRREHQPEQERVTGRDGKSHPAKQEPKDAGFTKPAATLADSDRGEWISDDVAERTWQSGAELGVEAIDRNIRSGIAALVRAIDDRKLYSRDLKRHSECVDALNHLQKLWQEWKKGGKA